MTDSFLALDGMEVLKVKPSERAVEDVLARAFEKHGTYSVPSAYRILMEDQTAKAMAVMGKQCHLERSELGKQFGSSGCPQRCAYYGGV